MDLWQRRQHGSNDGDAIVYYEPKKASSPVSELVMEQGVRTGATYSIKGEMPYRGPGAPSKFLREQKATPICSRASHSSRVCVTMRDRLPTSRSVGIGVSVYLANQAIEEGRRIMFADHARIK